MPVDHPPSNFAGRVTMGEGGTPLVSSRRVANLHFKLETTNPSGSYKDRFIAGELDRILSEGGRLCVATSSGNTGSSLAAYCARYGVSCVILVNADAPAGKLMQMRAHGATVIRIPDFVTAPAITQQVFAQLEAFTAAHKAALIVSAFRYCPVGMSEVRKIAREIAGQRPQVKHVFVPVGGGGLFSAISEEMQLISPETRVHAVQPEGCPTLLNADRTGAEAVAPVDSTTRISGLSVPFDIDAGRALRLLRQGGGCAIGVSDDQVFAAQLAMLREEGIYCEPAAAAALAGYEVARQCGLIDSGDDCVCLVTGSGFKDPVSIERAAENVASPIATTVTLPRLLEDLLR
jgi:threonine synthase